MTYLEITGDVSDCSDLHVLTNIVQSHPTLEVLVLENIDWIIKFSTELAQLVVSPGNLRKLTIPKHDITDLLPRNIIHARRVSITSTVFECLAVVLSNATSLTYLQITGYVSDIGLHVLTNIVQSHPTLEVLVLGHFDWIIKFSTELAHLVVSPGNLKKLTISGHDSTDLLPHKINYVKELTIPSTVFKRLATLLLNATSLTYLEITGNVYVSDSDLHVLINIVQSHPTLEVLVLGHIDWIIKFSTELARLVVSPGNIRKLSISGNDITEILPHKIKIIKKLTIPSTVFGHLAALLLNATSLTYLEITGDVLYSVLPVLTNIVQSHPTLEVLNISRILWVYYNSTELSTLVEAADNSQLKKLIIGECDIIELLNYKSTKPKKLILSGLLLQLFAALLPSISSLIYLEITDSVTSSGLPALTNIVQSHPTLEVMNINIGYVVNLTELSPLVEAAGNSRLKKLTIGQCDIMELLNYKNTNPKKLTLSVLLFQLFAALLPSITSLTYLEITGDVLDSDLPVLTNIVQSHPTLEVLNINNISRKWVHHSTELSSLVEAASSSQLKKLTIGKCDIIELLNYRNKNPKKLILSNQLLQLFGALLPNITSLTYLMVTSNFSDSDLLAVLTNIVQSHPTLEVLNIKIEWIYSSPKLNFLVEAASKSQLKKLTICQSDSIDEDLNYKPKKLVISAFLIRSLAAVLPNITSLTYLKITGHVSDSDLPVLVNIVQSHPTLEVLDIRVSSHFHNNQLQLSTLVETAGNSQLKELRLLKHQYDLLPSHIREAHKQLLKPSYV